MLRAPPRVSTSCLHTDRLLVSLQTRYLHRARIFAAKAKNDEPQSATGKRAISLLEELFPEATRRKTAKVPSKTTRHIPKIALENPIPLDEPSIEDRENPPLRTKFENLRRNRSIAVLALRKASKHLTKTDFRRVVPGAKHIEGWTRDGNILNIVRGRDPSTLEPDGTYFLVFDTPASAMVYKDHVLRLHRLSKAYLPGEFAGPIPPPPELGPDGRLAPGWNEIYTLMPASHELDMPLHIQPFSPLLRLVIEKSGYGPLVDGRRSEHEVLLTADWMQLRTSSLSRALAEDGRHRGIHWATISKRTGIRELVASPAAPQHMLGRPSGEEESRPPSNAPRRDGKKRFIVSFRDEAEAKRFALAWHQRNITDLLEGAPRYRQHVITEAEVVW